MLRNTNSTYILKMDQRTSTVDHSDYLRLPQSESKARKISQPVKIAQLLGSSGKSLTVSKPRKISQPVKIAQLLGSFGKSLTGSKHSAVKISQPERIPAHLRSVSTQKRNRIYTVNQLHPNERNVRRNLNFGGTPTTTREITKVNMSNLDDNPVMSKKSLRSSGRKSLLLPPNTIKDAHIRKSTARLRQSNSTTHCLNQTHALPTVHKSKYSRISEDLPSMGSTSVPVLQKGNNKMSVIQHTSSRMFNVNNQFGIRSLSSPYFNSTNANNGAMGRRILERANSDQASDAKIQSSQDSDCNIKSYKLRASSICNTNTRTDTELRNERFLDLDAKAAHMITSAEKTKDRMHSVKDAGTSVGEKYSFMTVIGDEGNSHERLQAVKMISCSNETNFQHDALKDCEYVILNKQKCKVLESELKRIISRLEEDVSTLKLIVASITNVPSVNTTNEITGDTKTKNKQQMTEHLNNMEAINGTNLTSSPCIILCYNDIESIYTPKEASKILNFDLLGLSETNVRDSRGNNFEIQSQQFDFIPEDNKENEGNSNTPINAKISKEPKSKTRRRSARLMAKASKDFNSTNDSFANLEKELNITNAKFDATIVSNRNSTPITNKSKNKAGRPMREYMAMKSHMSCLLTPNIKRFNPLMSEKDTQLEASGAKASLSNKIFAELHNLYADSPDSR